MAGCTHILNLTVETMTVFELDSGIDKKILLHLVTSVQGKLVTAKDQITTDYGKARSSNAILLGSNTNHRTCSANG